MPIRTHAAVALVVMLGLTACATKGEVAPAAAARTTSSPSAQSSPPHPPVVEPGVVWPTALHDVGHSGRSAFAGPTMGRVRWARHLEGNVTPGPVVAGDGTIYVSSNAGVLHALDPRTGADRWTLDSRASSGTDLSTSPAVLPSGVIVWPTPGRAVIGVAPDGSRLWSIDLDGTPTSPMPVGNRVYVMSTSGSLYALALTDGGSGVSIAWTKTLGGGSYASVAISPDGLIAVTTGHDVVAVRDAGDHATVAWRADLGALSETSPAIGPGGAVVASANSKWIQYFSADGNPLRRFDNQAISYSSAAVTDGVVVQGNHRSYVNGFDLATGVRRFSVHRWIRRAHRTAQVWTAPAIDRAANVYYGTYAGHIVGFSWTGALLFDIDAGENAAIDSYPAITADGALIVGDTTGVVRAIADDGTLAPTASAN